MNEEKNARRRIIDAYLELLKTKRYDRVTVASVIKKADVNRSTFYRHFLDIHDLYENICGETAELIVKKICEAMNNIFSDGFSLEKLNSAYETIFDIFVCNKDIIALLAGSRGSLMVVKKYRDKCEKSISSLIPLFSSSDSLEYQSGLIADVSILFVYSMYTLRTGEDLLKLKEILPDTPLKKDFVSNILTVNDILSEEKSSIEYKLLIATYEAWREKKTIHLTVSDITASAGISRTEFYLCHKNIADFYANFENIASYVLTKYVLETAFADIETLRSIDFDMKGLSESLGSFIGSIDHIRLFTFLFRTCGAAVDKYYQILKREKGESYTAGNEINILFYFSAVFVAVVRYAISGKEERFYRTMETAGDFKKMYEAAN